MNLNNKIAILWPTFDAYHVARFRCLFEKIGDRSIGIELVGGMGDDETGQWRSRVRGELPIVTLFPNKDMATISRKILGKTIVEKLMELEVETVFVNGYSTPELREVIFWASRNKKRCFTFFETKRDDFPRVIWKEWAKRWILSKVEGALCGGDLHRQYATHLGIPESKVVTGYDVVDNDFFIRSSNEARKNEISFRQKHGLPNRYFLSVSRFVEKKNLFRLLDAYKLYREKAGADSWGLVLCGGGSLGERLEKKVETEKISGVHFAGLQNGEDLAAHYALASAFILASTTEQWGLVVNEAMASSLPILGSRVAGATAELLIEAETGYMLDPLSVPSMTDAMLKMHQLPEVERQKMGRRARKLVEEKFPLRRFAEGVLKLINQTDGSKR